MTQIQDHREEGILPHQIEKVEVVGIRKSADVEEVVQVLPDQDQEAEKGENPVGQTEKSSENPVAVEILVQTEEEIGIETLNRIQVLTTTTEEKAAQGGQSALARVLHRRSTRKNEDKSLTIGLKHITSYVCTKAIILNSVNTK